MTGSLRRACQLGLLAGESPKDVARGPDVGLAGMPKAPNIHFLPIWAKLEG